MAVTATGAALTNAIKKRLSSQGTDISGNRLESVMLDVMATITANSGTAIADAVAEVAQCPTRPFVYGA